MSLAALRQQLAAVIAPQLPPGRGNGVSTGIAALDAALSDGGLPCGRLTEIVGRRGSGKTTLVREIVAQALADKRWVAYIDAGRTLAPADWASLAATDRLWIVRPPPPPATPSGNSPGNSPGNSTSARVPVAHAPWCADVLLRSGAFGLVVLDGGGALAPGVAIRLTRLARESNAAFVVLREEEEEHEGDSAPARGARRGSRPERRRGSGSGLVGGAVRLRVRRQERQHPGAPREVREQRRDVAGSAGTAGTARTAGAALTDRRWESLGRRLGKVRDDPGTGTSIRAAAPPVPCPATYEKHHRGSSPGRGAAPHAPKGGAQKHGEGDGPSSGPSPGPSPGPSGGTSHVWGGPPLVLQVSVEKGGTHHVVEVACAIAVARRMCTDSQVPDRRGVATRNRRGDRVAPPGAGERHATPAADGGRGLAASVDGAGGGGGGTLAPKRRCATPAIGRDEFLLAPSSSAGDGWGAGAREHASAGRPPSIITTGARRKPARPDPSRGSGDA